MTVFSVTVNGTDVTSRLKRIEVWQKMLPAGIGRFELTLLNENNQWTGAFPLNTEVIINAAPSGTPAQLMDGWIDSEIPSVRQTPEIMFERYMTIRGRDRGVDMMNKTTKNVWNDTADNILTALFSAAQSELTQHYLGSGSTPTIYYSSMNRAYLIDSIREILDDCNYEGFVNGRVLFYFPIGYVNSGITLKDYPANDPTNNIIRTVEHTLDCTEMRNYIIVFGPNVDDSWTEFNASKWSTGLSTTGPIVDYEGTSPAPYAGVAAIKIENSGTGSPNNFVTEGVLHFPNFNLSSLRWDLFPSDQMGFATYYYDSTQNPGVWAGPSVALTDDAGNSIVYNFGGSYNGRIWNYWTVPIGLDTIILGYNPTLPGWPPTGSWYYPVSGEGTFTWRITVIGIMWTDDNTTATNVWFLLDGLKLPQQIVSISDQTSGLTTRQIRHLMVNKPDITTQVELDAYAAQLGPKRKNPIENLKLDAIGSAGWISNAWAWIPGYYATVNIPTENISNALFRFINLHHIFEQEPTTDFDHVVELEMIPQTQLIDTQQWSYGTQDATALIRRLRDNLQALELRSGF